MLLIVLKITYKYLQQIFCPLLIICSSLHCYQNTTYVHILHRFLQSTSLAAGCSFKVLFVIQNVRYNSTAITDALPSLKLLQDSPAAGQRYIRTILLYTGGGVQQQKRSCRREKPRMSFVFFVLFCSFLKHL